MPKPAPPVGRGRVPNVGYSPISLLAFQRKRRTWQTPSGIGNNALAILHPNDGRLIVGIDPRQRWLVACQVSQRPNKPTDLFAAAVHAVEVAHTPNPSTAINSIQAITTRLAGTVPNMSGFNLWNPGTFLAFLMGDKCKYTR